MTEYDLAFELIDRRVEFEVTMSEYMLAYESEWREQIPSLVATRAAYVLGIPMAQALEVVTMELLEKLWGKRFYTCVR